MLLSYRHIRDGKIILKKGLFNIFPFKKSSLGELQTFSNLAFQGSGSVWISTDTVETTEALCIKDY